MGFLPIFVDLDGKPCLVVGGGAVAARKAARLLRAGAKVTIVAPAVCDELCARHDRGELRLFRRAFTDEDLNHCWLVVTATDDTALNKRVSELAHTRKILVNVADTPKLCSFIMPSVIDRSPVQVAVSTGGASPVLARLLRARLETLIPATYGHLASLMAEFREQVRTRFRDTRARRRFWEKALSGPVAELLFSGREQAALDALQRLLDDEAVRPDALGEVYLVGGGPGDPDLLTFRALRLMQQADVVLYDRLVAPQIVELVRKDADRVYVGKQRDQHALSQQEINALLVRLAKQGKRALRLKGGDPFIFGRGGEEIATLSAEGIPFQIVPGITAASGCACYAGIPLTHRDYAQSCVFVTGHLKDGSVELNWDALVQPQQTIVVYMGLYGIDKVCAGLKERGMPADEPAALVQQGTTPKQTVFTGTLTTLPEIVARHDIQPPTLLIIGQVVKLRDSLAWFESKQ